MTGDNIPCRDGRERRLAAALLAILAATSCGLDGGFAPLPAEVDLARLTPPPADFHRGVNLEAIGGPGGTPDLQLLDNSLEALTQLGIDHVAVVPGMIQQHLGDRGLQWQGGRQRVEDDTRAAIRLARARGLKVLLKPHLWLGDRADGAWRGDIAPDAAAWPAWSAAYRDAMLGFARLAEEEGVAGLSLGSELRSLTGARPEFWRQLASDSRAAFRGGLTYAANWDDEFDRIDFWADLDFIGVDAFWPLAASAEEVVTLESCRPRMRGIRDALREVARRAGRPVLLTEIGYKSTVGGLAEPWKWHEGGDVDLRAQAIAYACFAEVLGDAATNEDWLRGVYVWNWHASRRWAGGDNSDFTPRGKPAQAILEAWFRRPPPP